MTDIAEPKPPAADDAPHQPTPLEIDMDIFPPFGGPLPGSVADAVASLEVEN